MKYCIRVYHYKFREEQAIPGLYDTFDEALDKLGELISEYPEDEYNLKICEVTYG